MIKLLQYKGDSNLLLSGIQKKGGEDKHNKRLHHVDEDIVLYIL